MEWNGRVFLGKKSRVWFCHRSAIGIISFWFLSDQRVVNLLKNFDNSLLSWWVVNFSFLDDYVCCYILSEFFVSYSVSLVYVSSCVTYWSKNTSRSYPFRLGGTTFLFCYKRRPPLPTPLIELSSYFLERPHYRYRKIKRCDGSIPVSLQTYNYPETQCIHSCKEFWVVYMWTTHVKWHTFKI